MRYPAMIQLSQPLHLPAAVEVEITPLVLLHLAAMVVLEVAALQTALVEELATHHLQALAKEIMVEQEVLQVVAVEEGQALLAQLLLERLEEMAVMELPQLYLARLLLILGEAVVQALVWLVQAVQVVVAMEVLPELVMPQPQIQAVVLVAALLGKTALPAVPAL